MSKLFTVDYCIYVTNFSICQEKNFRHSKFLELTEFSRKDRLKVLPVGKGEYLWIER